MNTMGATQQTLEHHWGQATKDMHLWVRATVFLEKASRKWAQAMTVSTVIVSLPWQRKPASESWTDLSPSEF